MTERCKDLQRSGGEGGGHPPREDLGELVNLGPPQLPRNGYICRMSEVASRELRNDTAGVLRRVEAGEVVTITVKGKPVARLTAVAPGRRRWLSRVELAQRLKRAQADAGLRDDLAVLAGDTTDDLGPIQ